jgi:hypothetical protein
MGSQKFKIENSKFKIQTSVPCSLSITQALRAGYAFLVACFSRVCREALYTPSHPSPLSPIPPLTLSPIHPEIPWGKQGVTRA